VDNAPWEDFLACRDGLTADASWAASTLQPSELRELHTFVSDNPMARVAERIEVPDVAAPLGWYLMCFGAFNLRHDFAKAELETRYGTHEGYVDAYRSAAETLIRQGLWDAALGLLQVDQIDASDVLGE